MMYLTISGTTKEYLMYLTNTGANIKNVLRIILSECFQFVINHNWTSTVVEYSWHKRAWLEKIGSSVRLTPECVLEKWTIVQHCCCQPKKPSFLSCSVDRSFHIKCIINIYSVWFRGSLFRRPKSQSINISPFSSFLAHSSKLCTAPNVV